MLRPTATHTAETASITVSAAITVRHEQTRVLAALNQAADQEPAVRAVFNELLNQFVAEIGGLLKKLELESSEANIDLLHALFRPIDHRPRHSQAKRKGASQRSFEIGFSRAF
jgi:glutamyl-tRNA reductase